MTTIHDATPVPRLGGKLAVILFIFTLLAFVAESQLTQVLNIPFNLTMLDSTSLFV